MTQYHKIFVSYKHHKGLYEIGAGGLSFVIQQVWDWLHDHMGPGQRVGDLWFVNSDTRMIGDFYYHGREFMFLRKEDAMLFKLTWL